MTDHSKGAEGLDDLLSRAHGQGVVVMWGSLGRRRGEYRHSHRLITLNPKMSGSLQRSTLAHELGHAHYGDTRADSDVLHDFQERRANQYAAGLLISPAEYALAERLYGPHAGALAKELGVARYIVEAWQSSAQLRRVG